MDKKGQVSLSDAPSIVMIVGMLFLVMATLAFIATSYQTAFTSNVDMEITNESLGLVKDAGQTVSSSTQCNFENFAAIIVINTTGEETIPSTNYTITSAGLIYYSGAEAEAYNNTPWTVSYSYDQTGISCNVTAALNKELSDNTSIAGMVLTISLVGIVLSILIGVFVATRRKGF